MLKENDQLPLFSLKDENGKTREITEFLGGKNLILFFYPKDFTPGCTKEACSFRDNYQVLREADAEVVGISADSPERHLKFKKAYHLPFALLSDEKNKVRKLFGLKGQLFGIIPDRVTYVVNNQGRITHVFHSMLEYDKHVKSALNELRKAEV